MATHALNSKPNVFVLMLWVLFVCLSVYLCVGFYLFFGVIFFFLFENIQMHFYISQVQFVLFFKFMEILLKPVSYSSCQEA